MSNLIKPTVSKTGTARLALETGHVWKRYISVEHTIIWCEKDKRGRLIKSISWDKKNSTLVLWEGLITATPQVVNKGNLHKALVNLGVPQAIALVDDMLPSKLPSPIHNIAPINTLMEAVQDGTLRIA